MRSKSMTITDETTGQPTDPPATSSPSFFQRICCCCTSDLKEPPVQLIRSGSLTYQQGAAPSSTSNATPDVPPTNNVISAAKDSVDDEIPQPKPTPKTQAAPKQEEDTESVNMNDLLMENVLKSTEEDRTEAVEEDNVSISTNVVQEVDEVELKKALNKVSNDSNEVPKLKGRSGISKELSASESSGDEAEGENRKMSVIEFIRSEAHGESSTTIPSLPVPQIKTPDENVQQNEKLSEATQSEMSDSEDEVTSDEEGVKQVVGMSSKSTARAEKGSDGEERRIREFRELSSDESLKGSTGEEIMVGEESDGDEVPPPLPSSPPPRLSAYVQQAEGSPIPPPRSPQRTSLMYAHADDDSSDDSDDEASGESHPVASNGLVRMHPVNFAAHKEEDEQSVSSESSMSTASDVSEKENDNEETSIGVTRISVKSDGRAEIHSPRSPVRVTLEPDRNEVTDDDFSEKLI